MAKQNYEIGQVVADRYVLDGRIGSGGMAEVYSALDRNATAGSEKVALKLLHARYARSSEARKRLRREAEILEELDHPSIVKFRDTGVLEDKSVYVAMELLRGKTLRQLLEVHVAQSTHMSVALVNDIVEGVGSALAVAHEAGVVHRDVKPENIYVHETSATGASVKLLDFGISKAFEKDRLTATGQIVGTPKYMAPEQLEARAIDARADQYALATIADECLSGAHPYDGLSTNQLIVAVLKGGRSPLSLRAPYLPPELCAVVDRGSEATVTARFPSLIAFLEKWRAHTPTPRAKSARRGTLVMGSFRELQASGGITDQGFAEDGERTTITDDAAEENARADFPQSDRPAEQPIKADDTNEPPLSYGEELLVPKHGFGSGTAITIGVVAALIILGCIAYLIDRG